MLTWLQQRKKESNAGEESRSKRLSNRAAQARPRSLLRSNCDAVNFGSGALRIVLSESEKHSRLRGRPGRRKWRPDVVLAIGPEGGWAEDELRLFQAMPDGSPPRWVQQSCGQKPPPSRPPRSRFRNWAGDSFGISAGENRHEERSHLFRNPRRRSQAGHRFLFSNLRMEVFRDQRASH